MKMYCIFSRESLKAMKGIRGKMTSQAGHAFLHAFWDSEENFLSDATEYAESAHAVKITCVVDTQEELERLYEIYKDVCGTTRVVDSAFTVLDGPMLTCVGIGPIRDEDEDEDEELKKLELLK